MNDKKLEELAYDTNVEDTPSAQEVWEEEIRLLEERLKKAHAKVKEIKDQKKVEVKPKYEFTFLPHQQKFDRIYDDTIVIFRLAGVITNKQECLDAGRPEHTLSAGGMNYLYNKGSGRIVMSTGGGRVWIREKSWSSMGDSVEAIENELQRVLYELELFVRRNPEGGDVTDIIVEHMENR
jgi:hypothetical protein